MVTHVGEERVFRGQACPRPMGQGPSIAQFWGYSLLRPIPLTWNDQFRRSNTFGRGIFLGVSNAPYSKGQGLQHSPILGFSPTYAVFSQIHVAFAAVATALHCKRFCARRNVHMYQRYASIGRDVIKPGGSKSST